MYKKPYKQFPRRHGNGGFRGGQKSFSRFKKTKKTLDPAFFVRKAEVMDLEVYTPKHTFQDFAINPQLKENIKRKGYKIPTPIQDQAIPHLLEGHDVIGIANTGTGKTAAFLIPLIHKISQNPSQRVLIITPTRELAVQIDTEFREFCQNMHLYSVVCIGGVSIQSQLHLLKRKPHFVIGTLGRLRDLEKMGRISFDTFRTIVLDEVDQMLDMGFIHDVKYVVSKLPRPRQSLFFSATLPPSVAELMRQFVQDPITISIKTQRPSTNVDQDIIRVEGRSKVDILYDLLKQSGFDKVLVFGRTKWGTEKLARALNQRGVMVAAIHGNKNQNQRQRAIEQFKRNQVQVLLATDVASRGLDINNVTHVINFDVPETYEDYIHRIGRTGRADKKGKALTFID